MFDRMGAGMNEQKASRDSTTDSLMGTSAARRELGVELGVDPYTDFPPLSQKLDEIARASALGGLSVKAALSVVPGVGGIAVSSSATADSLKETLRDKTSAQIAQQVKAALQKLKVTAKSSTRLVENRLYTPADLLLLSTALTQLKAGSTELFVSRASQASTRDVAIFQRDRAVMLAAKSSELGGIVEFVSVSGFPLNRTRDGTIVAVFPLDDLAWTEVASRAFISVTGALRLTGYEKAPVLATTATVTPMTEDEIKKLGWTVVVSK